MAKDDTLFICRDIGTLQLKWRKQETHRLQRIKKKLSVCACACVRACVRVCVCVCVCVCDLSANTNHLFEIGLQRTESQSKTIRKLNFTSF